MRFFAHKFTDKWRKLRQKYTMERLQSEQKENVVMLDLNDIFGQTNFEMSELNSEEIADEVLRDFLDNSIKTKQDLTEKDKQLEVNTDDTQ